MHALKDKLHSHQLDDLKLMVSCMVKKMADTLAQGEPIKMIGFGRFDCLHRPSPIARKPKTGATVNLPAKSVTHFKSRKETSDRGDAVRDKLSITE